MIPWHPLFLAVLSKCKQEQHGNCIGNAENHNDLVLYSSRCPRRSLHRNQRTQSGNRLWTIHHTLTLSGSKACFGGKHLGTKPLIMAKSRLSWHKEVYLGTKQFILAQSRLSWHRAVHLGTKPFILAQSRPSWRRAARRKRGCAQLKPALPAFGLADVGVLMTGVDS